MRSSASELQDTDKRPLKVRRSVTATSDALRVTQFRELRQVDRRRYEGFLSETDFERALTS